MAYLIDNTNEEISFGNYSAIDELDIFSYVGWFYINGDGGGGFQRLFDKRQSGSVGHVLWRQNGTQLAFYDYTWSTNPGGWVFTEPSFSQWFHLAVTYDATDTGNVPTIYFDASTQSTSPASNPAGTHTNSNNEELIVGNRAAGDRWLDGEVAEFAMYDRVLTAGEVSELAAGYTPDHIQDGLVLYAPLVGDANNEVEGNHGTVTGATVSSHPGEIIELSAEIIQFPPAAAAPATTIPPIYHHRQNQGMS